MKNFFILFLLTLCTQSVFAQKFSFGLKGGANITDWYYSTPPKSSVIPNDFHAPEISYEFGLTAYQRLSKKISLNEELLYTGRNTSVNKKWLNGQSINLNSYYIALPIFVSYNFYGPLSIDLGGEYSRLVNSDVFDYKKIFVTDNFFSGVIGLKYNFLKHFNIHCRYVHTFNKIAEVTWTDFNATEIGKSKLRSRTFTLAVGYNF